MHGDDDLLRDDRPLRYEEPGKVIYRASSLGSCTRAFIAAANGHAPRPHPSWFQEILDEGTRTEHETAALWMEQTGHATILSQGEVELECGEVDGKLVVVRGHIDGVCEGYPKVLREYKKFRVTTWDDFVRRGVEVNANYPWQVSVYMHGGEYTECEFVGGKYLVPEVGEPYIAEVFCHVLTAPPIPRKAIVKRVLMIESKIAQGFDVQDMDCDKSMFPCPYYYLPGHAKEDQGFTRRLDASDELCTLAAEYGEQSVAVAAANKQAKVLDAQLKETRGKLLAYLKDHGVNVGDSVAIGDTGIVASWNETERAASVTKAYTITKLTIKKEA